MQDWQLLSLELKGELLITSEQFYGVHYAICDGGIRIYAAKDGKMQISGEYAEDFVSELTEIVNVFKYKWKLGYKGGNAYLKSLARQKEKEAAI